MRRSRNRYAYVFYATNDTYAVAVLVFIHLLRQLGVRQDADVVVLHLRLAPHLLDKMRNAGIITRRVARLPYTSGNGFEDCLVKLRILRLAQYERVIYSDADAIPLQSLDPLFTAPFDGPLAAPSAYWIPQPFWTSHLLVIKPSADLWKRVRRRFGSAKRMGYYDMEIINAEFGGEIQTLPAGIACLNSEWEDVRGPRFFGDPAETYAKVSVVHFTALGKPWFYSAEEARQLRPRAHPIFYELWDRWWKARAEVFRGAELDQVMFSRSTGIGTREGQAFWRFSVGNQFEAEAVWAPVFRDDEYRVRDTRFTAEDVVIDVGAHIGTFAYLCYICGSRSIYCYEPSEHNFHRLKINLGALPGTHLFNSAVWRSDGVGGGELVISRPDGDNTGAVSALMGGRVVHFASQSVSEVMAGGTAPAVALDEILGRFPRIKVLKVDCEGSEFPILLTSHELHRVERIVAEVHEVGAQVMAFLEPGARLPGYSEYRLASLVARLEEAGFNVSSRPGQKHMYLIDAVRTAAAKRAA